MPRRDLPVLPGDTGQVHGPPNLADLPSMRAAVRAVCPYPAEEDEEGFETGGAGAASEPGGYWLPPVIGQPAIWRPN